MSTGRKTPPEPHDLQHTPARQPNLRQPQKPSNIVQPKTVAATSSAERPSSPPTVNRSHGLPKAPPVYRPQPLPKVLQRKKAFERQQPAANQAPRQPVAPPVYRPQPMPVQAKMATVSGRAESNVAKSRTPRAPSVHHFRQATVVQRMINNQSTIDKSKNNVKKYATAFYVKYQAIIDELINNGFVVRGHASGGTNSGMNQATKDDLRRLRDEVRIRNNGNVELTDEEEQEWGSKSEKMERLPSMESGGQTQMYEQYCQARQRAKWAKEDKEDPRAAFMKYLNSIWANKGFPEKWKDHYIEEYDNKPI